MPIACRTLPDRSKVRAAGRIIEKLFSRKAIAILLLCLVISGCSTRFLYNQLDSFVVWKVGGLVSLESDQKAELKQRVGDQLEFVRMNEMPQIASGLRDTALEIETKRMTAEMVDRRYQESIELIDKVMLGIVPIAEWFLLSLSEEQVDELFESLEEFNQEMYEEYSGRTPEERRKNRDKSAVKFMQRFTGRLNDDQKLLITDSLASMDDASEQWIEYQREWQRRFRELIVNPPPTEQFRAELTTLFVYPRSFHTAEYRAVVDANRHIFYEMFAELVNGLSDKQRSRFVDKLEGYAEMVAALAEN